MREQDQKGRESMAERRGQLRGQLKEKYAVAKRCLENGMTIELSAQISGLTIAQVKEIK